MNHNTLLIVWMAAACAVLAACGGAETSSHRDTSSPNGGGGVTQSYTVTANVTGLGTISPTSVSVANGGVTTFTLMPSSGHQVSSVTGCGGTLSGATYTTGAITSTCTVTATFTAIAVPPASYAVSTSVIGMGAISPTSANVTSGGATAFTLSHSPNFQLASVSGCGGSLGGMTYTTGAITSACTVTATFTSVPAPSTGDPVLHFSDLISGPDTGLGDGLGSGVIVTVWGQHLGSSQGTSTIEFCDSASVCRTGYVYYWKNADGVAPSGPANLFESHGMQEIAMSIPDSALGAGSIRVTVGGETSSLPFTVREGSIFHVKPSGNDSNPGTFNQPWQTAGKVGHTSSGATAPAGSTTYFHGIFSGGISTSSNRGIYINNSAASSPDSSIQFFYVAYPGPHSTASGQEGFTNYRFSGASISKFRIEASNCTETANGQRTDCGTISSSGIRTDKWGRVVGNHLTDQPGRCASMYQGAIAGGANSEDNVSNTKIFGNEIEEYGCYGTGALHHTTYMSIRSALRCSNKYPD